MQQNKIWGNTLVSAEGNLQRYFFPFFARVVYNFCMAEECDLQVKMRCARIWIHPLLNSKIRLDRTGAEIAPVLSTNCQQF